MSWVDVNDTTGIVTVDYGQVGKDIVNVPSNFTQSVTGGFNNAVDAVSDTVGGAVDTVTAPVTNFIDKGRTEGYGEAVWQDVVQPMSNIPGATRGAIVGTTAGIVKDVLDPKPGINPMNALGGGAVGALVGATAPYAVDAIQALSNPNSMLRGSTYSKALEGAGIASGITGEVDPRIQEMVSPGFGEKFTERGLNVAKNVTEGVDNAYQGALAGADQLGADVAGFFGFDRVEDMYQVLADNRRKAMEDNSAVGAVAEEAMYDAGMGGVLGKGAETIGAVGKGVGRWANSNVINRGMNALDEIVGTVRNKVNPNMSPSGRAKPVIAGVKSRTTQDANKKAFELVNKTVDEIVENKAMFPGAQAVTDLVGTFSPKVAKFLETSWDDMAAYVFGGKDASLRAYDKMTKNLMKYGYDKNEAQDMIMDIAKNPKITEPLKKALSTPTSTGLSKLLGTTTAITADVEDY